MQIAVAEIHIDVKVAVRLGKPTLTQNADDVSVIPQFLQIEEDACLALDNLSHRCASDMNDFSREWL